MVLSILSPYFDISLLGTHANDCYSLLENQVHYCYVMMLSIPDEIFYIEVCAV